MLPVGAELSEGTVFAQRYRIGRLLRAGGMGAVYVAQHVRTHDWVALKVMRPELVRESSARTRFEQEARISSLIGDSGVVKVIDADIDAVTGVPFLVMELLRGTDLADLVRSRGRVSSAEVARYLAQITRTLDKAHAAGVVHRDLKPENLFLEKSEDEPPRIKILDFGIAKLLLEATARTTHAGGTPLYMAPEQTRRSGEIGSHTDIWALGLITYTLLVGAPYWEAGDVHQLYGELLGDAYESPRARAARRGVSLPETFDDWFFQCVNRDPNARFDKATTAAAALAVALAVSPSSTVDEYAKTEPCCEPMTGSAGEDAGADLVTTTQSPLIETASPAAPRRRTSLGLAAFAVVAAASIGWVRWSTGRTMQTSSSAVVSASASPEGTVSPPTGMALLPAGSFTTGEKRTSANIASFYLDRFEVSVADFEACVETQQCTAPNADHPACNWGKADRALHPVTCVDWHQASAYCAARGKRLPTEEEWEWAARGGDKSWIYPWGTEAPARRACWNGESNDLGLGRRRGTCPVGSHVASDNPWEVHDLAGNVWEWTASVEAGTKRVVRGGSWHSTEAQRLGASFRYRRDPSERDIVLGFRCARSP